MRKKWVKFTSKRLPREQRGNYVSSFSFICDLGHAASASSRTRFAKRHSRNTIRSSPSSHARAFRHNERLIARTKTGFHRRELPINARGPFVPRPFPSRFHFFDQDPAWKIDAGNARSTSRKFIRVGSPLRAGITSRDCAITSRFSEFLIRINGRTFHFRSWSSSTAVYLAVFG